eukprot:CAMPEP_0202782062 /NCGR_PEP_ID=MMETSP1388-20130828/61953_1 /ASSEMBLY_ACC=CAM_ASM_000864 /TAXON_ID=37098 /ORGANISM="Isochrysis sp, Strain CCMP1244" /LENGTH=69 /DNA_ID=CAMNT_0049451491 /DNA_START=8 /DNA_END=213 /DNA_ORIENTATION=-
MSAVSPLLFCRSSSAPRASRTPTSSSLPLAAANISSVYPVTVRRGLPLRTSSSVLIALTHPPASSHAST